MSRASKPETAAHEGPVARPARQRTSVRPAKPELEASAEVAEALQQADLEAPVVEVPDLEISGVGTPVYEAPGSGPAAEAMPPAAGLPFEAAAAEPARPEIELVAAVAPAVPVDLAPDAVPVDPAPALGEVQGLHDITLRFWQDEFGRAMAAGQAIMLCRSPQEALRLQMGYLQAALTAGFAHAGELARLSQSVAPKMLPSRPH